MLDRAVKFLMVILAISTVIATVLAFINLDYSPPPQIIQPEIWTVSGVAFLISLMSWMPILINEAAWQSVWSIERIKQTGYKPKLNEVLFDFNLGYMGAAIIALCFLILGAMVMYGSGQDFASSAASFSYQLVELNTTSMGDWAYLIIMPCVFTAMFSNNLTVTSTYPDVVNHFVHIRKHGHSSPKSPSQKRFKYLLIGVSAGTLILLWLLGDRFRFLIDLNTTLSFLTMPVLAFINHKLIHQSEVKTEFRPRKWLYTLSISGIVFFTMFAPTYLYWMILN